MWHFRCLRRAPRPRNGRCSNDRKSSVLITPRTGDHTLPRFEGRLGRCCTVERAVLRSIDAFLVADGAKDLTSDSFRRWVDTQQHLKSGVRRDRMRIVRNLCLYRRRTVPSCFVPDETLFPPLHQYVQPHIFSEEEIARLIDTTRSLLSTRAYPLRSDVFRLGIGLLYTTGLRRGELLRLRIGDYDSRTQTLLIRPSKFHKSRLLPLSIDAAQEVDRYLAKRDASRPDTTTDEAPLFWNGSSALRSYAGPAFVRVFRDLLQKAGICKANGQLPRVHDVRPLCANIAETLRPLKLV